ncbi:transposase, partial [Moorena sp. SIO3H5]|uniref:transposase n=1 Tax=Moorena sp. SIO3H5 TaxID=2607834 RepID=UPI0013BD86F0
SGSDRRGHDITGSRSWGKPPRPRYLIKVGFASSTCKLCLHRPLCTRTKKQGRTITLRPQRQHNALQQARQTQTTEDFQHRYAQRAGIEGTLAQGIKAFGLRRCRYIGLTKTHLQHIITACAMNIVRLVNWWLGVPFAATRCSRFAALAPTG